MFFWRTGFLFILISVFTTAQAQPPSCTGTTCLFLPLMDNRRPPSPLCGLDPDPATAPNFPLRITRSGKSDVEFVNIRNTQRLNDIFLIDWTLCSLNGNEEFPLRGFAIPDTGAADIVNTGQPVLNDTERDDLALYNPEGQLISYFADTGALPLP